MNFKGWLKENVEQEEFGVENHSKKKELVVLVGPPAVGKSTFVQSKFPKGSVYLVSRDDIVDEVARSFGMTYDDMWELPGPDSKIGETVPGKEQYGIVEAAPPWMKWSTKVYSNVLKANYLINSELENRFTQGIESGLNVVADMTHMTPFDRQRALKHVKGKDFFKRAVVFTLKDSDVPTLLSRMRKRSDAIKSMGGSKTIGDDVVYRSIKNFQRVTPEEGFDRVETIYTFLNN